MCRLSDMGGSPGGAAVADCDIPATCDVIDEPECLSLTRLNGSGDIATGQEVTYEAQYTSPAGVPPYGSIQLYVSPDGTVGSAVGEDAEGTGIGNTLVNPNTGFPQDSGSGIWTYQFTWAATGVVDATTYEVRMLLDGSTVESVAACQSSITIDDLVPLEPDLTPVKTATMVCIEGGGVIIDYTITVTNGTSVDGAILDQVIDSMPGLGILSNINPAPTSSNNSTIIWDGPFTLDAGESISFTYTLTLNYAETLILEYTGVENSVTIEFDGNTRTYDLRVPVDFCLPDTGLFEDNPVLLIGLLLIVFGILVNRSGVILNVLGANTEGSDATSKFLEGVLGEERFERLTSGPPTFEEKVARDTAKKIDLRDKG